MRFFFIFLLSIISVGAFSQKVHGDWFGILDTDKKQEFLLFQIVKKDGNYQTTLITRMEGRLEYPMETTTFNDNELVIENKEMQLKYVAQLSKDEQKLVGTFYLGDRSHSIILTKERLKKDKLFKDQDPKDFPYIQEEISFENPKGNHRLSGTLTIPSNREFEKVVILISGSGPQNRNEKMLEHKPFLVLSDHFTRKGIAVLRYDDRGIGWSGGKFEGATSRDFADDVHAAVTYLKNRKDMKDKSIGLAGHSEGGMIAPIVAVENADVKFIVLLAAPGIPIKELMLLQLQKIAEVAGQSEKVIAINQVISSQIYELIIENKTMEKEELSTRIDQLIDKLYEELSEEDKKLMGAKEYILPKPYMEIILGDWYLYFIRFDPSEYLEKVECPVLAINGDLDLQVTSKENLEGIEKSLTKGGNKNFEIRAFKNLNHLFQTTKTGAIIEYGILDETFNEEPMKLVTDWILKL